MEIKEEKSKYKFPICRSIENYEKIGRISEGSFGVVFQAKEKTTGEIVAIKKIKIDQNQEGFPLTSIREINILKRLNHPNIVHLKEICFGSNNQMAFMIMDHIDHDLGNILKHLSSKENKLTISEIKCIMIQLLKGMEYLHDNWVIHRDLKPKNLLLSSKGELKICDFGMARTFGDPLGKYTNLVITLWYRPPEILLGEKEYSTAVDMWSIGCIFAELLTRTPLFQGDGEIGQLQSIFDLLGVPTEDIWKGFNNLPYSKKFNFIGSNKNKLNEKFKDLLSSEGLKLLNGLLCYDPKKRLTAKKALESKYFKESPYPQNPEMMRTFKINDQ